MLEARDPRAIAGRTNSIAALAGPAILVSNEVGMGSVPDHQLGREFRDWQGRANRRSPGLRCGRLVAATPLQLKPAATPSVQLGKAKHFPQRPLATRAARGLASAAANGLPAAWTVGLCFGTFAMGFGGLRLFQRQAPEKRVAFRHRSRRRSLPGRAEARRHLAPLHAESSHRDARRVADDPSRSSLKAAREFAERHAAWIGTRLARLPNRSP